MDNKPLTKIKVVDLNSEIKQKGATRLRTSFIYAIAQLEEIFGDLWGEKKNENDVFSKEEEEIYEKFCLWRKQVLDNGNNQIRIFNSEVDRTLR